MAAAIKRLHSVGQWAIGVFKLKFRPSAHRIALAPRNGSVENGSNQQHAGHTATPTATIMVNKHESAGKMQSGFGRHNPCSESLALMLRGLLVRSWCTLPAPSSREMAN